MFHPTHINCGLRMADIRFQVPLVGGIRKRKRLKSASNPQLSQTVNLKDSDTNGLFHDIQFERGNYFEGRQSNIHLGLPLQLDGGTSMSLNSRTSGTNHQSTDSLDRQDSASPVDSLEQAKHEFVVSVSPIQEFVSVDKYESPYLGESAYRISSFCLEHDDDGSGVPEGNDEEGYISSGNSRFYMRNPLLVYSDSMDSLEEGPTLPPIYEVEGEGSEITELASSPTSSQLLRTECTEGGAEKPEAHTQSRRQSCHDSCAQYCSQNDSIMSYYSVVPPEEGRESVRNVDHLVDRLDVKHRHSYSSPSSPFPLTPPNTCDSSPKLSNTKATAGNNQHALSGVEVKYCWPVLRSC